MTAFTKVWQENRAAERPAKIVLPLRRLGLAKIVIEPVARIEDVISDVIESSAVPLIRAGTRYERELPTWIASILR